MSLGELTSTTIIHDLVLAQKLKFTFKYLKMQQKYIWYVKVHCDGKNLNILVSNFLTLLYISEKEKQINFTIFFANFACFLTLYSYF